MSYAINVLFIDDSQSNAEATAAEFIRQGYAIKYDHVSTYNGLISKLKNNPYDLIVSEYSFSGMSVMDVSNLLLEMDCEIPLIVISDHDDGNDMINCIKAGCRDYLVRSNISRLKLAVLSICCEAERRRQGKEEQKQLIEQNKYLSTTLESTGKGLIVADLDRRIILMNNIARKPKSLLAEKEQWASLVNDLKQKLDESTRRAVNSLIKIMKVRDMKLYLHSNNVSRYALMIANAVGMPGERKKELKCASLVHDIGKITVRDSILYKRDSLNLDEFEEIKKHSAVGAEIIEELGYPGNVSEIVRQHHEWIDGTGYPLGLKGDRILLEAKILSVADVFDALTSDRVYRKRMSVEKALEIMKSESGTHFDPDILNVFLRKIQDPI